MDDMVVACLWRKKEKIFADKDSDGSDFELESESEVHEGEHDRLSSVHDDDDDHLTSMVCEGSNNDDSDLDYQSSPEPMTLHFANSSKKWILSYGWTTYQINLL